MSGPWQAGLSGYATTAYGPILAQGRLEPAGTSRWYKKGGSFVMALFNKFLVWGWFSPNKVVVIVVLSSLWNVTVECSSLSFLSGLMTHLCVIL